jgi:hypothetical protein
MSQTEVIFRRSSMTNLRRLLAAIPEMKGHAPGKDQEYVNGWGIFALPFESGDVLALRVRERIAHGLGMGHIQLNGVMPSGHRGHLMPEQMFFIDEARATLNGTDLGRPVRLPSNPTIGEFRLPSRGVLVKGGAVWDILDPVEYERTRAATGEPRGLPRNRFR